MDDGIFTSSKESDINKTVVDLKFTHFNLENRGIIADYLGLNINYKKNGEVIMTQPQLIKQIIEDTKLEYNAHLPPTPTVSSRMLRREENDPAYQEKNHYRSLVEKINYFEESNIPDITFATHSCARFCESPGATHYRSM